MAAVMAWVTKTVVAPVMGFVGIFVGMYKLHEALAKVLKGTYELEQNAYRHHGEQHYEIKECG